ncbi:hypothetical protein BDL97_14G105000 [Sphagnum fallax]|nr:hypothetical protein BDL97_14G105000 [Sphagnum fallax]
MFLQQDVMMKTLPSSPHVETVEVFANGGDMVAEDGFHMCLVETVQIFANEGDIVAEDGCACGTY